MDRVRLGHVERAEHANDPTYDRVVATYEAHQREIFSFARHATRSAEAAEDVVSEVFLRLVAEARANRFPEQPRAWLYRVAANLVVSRARRFAVAQRFKSVFVDRSTSDPADRGALEHEQSRELYAALGTLPREARIALVLAAQGFSGEEIAALLGKSPAATRTLMCRARLKLREQLQDERR